MFYSVLNRNLHLSRAAVVLMSGSLEPIESLVTNAPFFPPQLDKNVQYSVAYLPPL